MSITNARLQHVCSLNFNSLLQNPMKMFRLNIIQWISLHKNGLQLSQTILSLRNAMKSTYFINGNFIFRCKSLKVAECCLASNIIHNGLEIGGILNVSKHLSVCFYLNFTEFDSWELH